MKRYCFLKSLYTVNFSCAICLASFILMSCKKESIKASKRLPEPVVVADNFMPPATHALRPGTITYPFFFQAGGPFSISPVSATVVKINQEMFITSASPFLLKHGYVRGFDDLTIPTFPDRFFDGSFTFSGQGNDSLFATVTVQTSLFFDPVDPANGDFFGSEDFTGTFQITGGTGHYLNATGSGDYAAHSEWRPPATPGTFFSGFTTVNATGTISVVARSGQLESGEH
jgi:hypothetical protein